MHVLQREQSDLFFQAVRLNAIFSIICGLSMALGASTVADGLGIDRSTDVMVIGIVTMFYIKRFSTTRALRVTS